MKQERLQKAIRERREELFIMLSRLIRINSENFGSYGNEKEIAELLAKEFRALGYEAETYSPLDVEGITEHRDYYPGHGLENRPNMTVVIPGSDHAKRLMLAAHSDTVEIGDLSNWSVDPLGGEIRDGRVWGRGACDDKYGIAMVWYLVRLLRDEGITLPYDLVFTAYCDEEKGGGNGTLAACLRYPVDDVVNIDGLDRMIVVSGTGGGCLSASIATKEPVDNCEVLLDGIAVYRKVIDAFRKRRHDELMEYPRYKDGIIPDTAVRFEAVRVGEELSLNRARADICFFTSKTEEEIMKELDAMKEELGEKLAPLGMVFEGFRMTTRFFRFAESAYDNPTLELWKHCLKTVAGEELDGVGAGLGDHPLFVNYGSPRSICIGAAQWFGDYGGPHQPDEYVDCERLTVLTEVLGDFLMHYGEL